MTREAARDGFETFLESTMTATHEEFRLGRALRGTGLSTGGAIVDRLRGRTDRLEAEVVEPELDGYRDRALAQFDAVLDYAESDDPIAAFRDEILQHDSCLDALDPDVSPDRREAVIADVLAHNRSIGDAVAPVVARPEAAFWPALQAAFDREGALESVEAALSFTDPLRRHREVLTFDVRFDPAETFGGVAASLPTVHVEYTDEAIRAMRRAEGRTIHEAKREVRRRFDA